MGRKYQNLEIFRLGYDIAIDIYKITENFPKHEMAVLTNQLRRAAISIPSNIAEGSTRYSAKEFLMFLTYAYGSAKEIVVQLSIAKDIGYVQYAAYNTLSQNLDKFQAYIYKFMRDLEKKTPYSFYREYKKNMEERKSN